MKTITFDGKTYHCPLSEKFRRHDAAERERMDESGDVEYPVLLYRDRTHRLDNCVMDGEGRLEAAVRTGAAVEFKHVGELTTDEAYARAVALNDARRHDDPEAIARRRRERVARKRVGGKSLRTIAAEEEVSESQIRRDLESAGAPPPAHLPEKVAGKDGKEYPATRPAPAAAPAAEPEPDAAEDTLDAAADAETLPPEDAPAPGPTRNGRRRPGPVGPAIDPDHPHAELLQAVATLAGRVSAACNDEPEDSNLRLYLFQAGLCWSRDKYVNGRKYGWKCVGLRGIFRIIKLAGAGGPRLSKEQIRAAYDRAMNPDADD